MCNSYSARDTVCLYNTLGGIHYLLVGEGVVESRSIVNEYQTQHIHGQLWKCLAKNKYACRRSYFNGFLV